MCVSVWLIFFMAYYNIFLMLLIFVALYKIIWIIISLKSGVASLLEFWAIQFVMILDSYWWKSSIIIQDVVCILGFRLVEYLRLLHYNLKFVYGSANIIFSLRQGLARTLYACTFPIKNFASSYSGNFSSWKVYALVRIEFLALIKVEFFLVFSLKNAKVLKLLLTRPH